MSWLHLWSHAAEQPHSMISDACAQCCLRSAELVVLTYCSSASSSASSVKVFQSTFSTAAMPITVLLSSTRVIIKVCYLPNKSCSFHPHHHHHSTAVSKHNIITYTTQAASVSTCCMHISKHLLTSKPLLAHCLQEPDVFGLRWEAANGKPGYADLCIKLMDAAYSIVPNALFLVEGTGQSGLSYNWGELLSHCM